jgi:hypothetical protein
MLFVCALVPCHEGFPPASLVFFPPYKINISKFQCAHFNKLIIKEFSMLLKCYMGKYNFFYFICQIYMYVQVMP